MPDNAGTTPPVYTAKTFCELQGCDVFTTQAIVQFRKLAGMQTYDDWYTQLKGDFNLGACKQELATKAK